GVDVALGGCVDHEARVGDGASADVEVGDVAHHQLRTVREHVVVDVADVARVGHLVEDQDAIVGVAAAHLVDDVRARKTGAAGDDDGGHGTSRLLCWVHPSPDEPLCRKYIRNIYATMTVAGHSL